MPEDTIEDREARKQNKRHQLEYLARQLADDLTRCWPQVSESITKRGYRQLRITIEDAATGEVIDCLQTYEKMGLYPNFYYELRGWLIDRMKEPPNSLLEILTASVPEAGREVTAKEMIDRQLMGGRQPDKRVGYAERAKRIISEGTIEAYDREYGAWYRAHITDNPDCPPRLDPDAEATFYQAMYRYGVRKKDLEK